MKWSYIYLLLDFICMGFTIFFTAADRVHSAAFFTLLMWIFYVLAVVQYANE